MYGPNSYEDNPTTKVALSSNINCPICRQPISGTESYIKPTLGRLRYCKSCKVLFRRAKQKPTKSPKIIISVHSNREQAYYERRKRKCK